MALINSKLENYRPKKVRRVFIPKPNGKERPLGIPCIVDRIIQQCFKQILEPIAEAKFYKHSYGFKPLKSTHHAMARVQHLINICGLHYVIAILSNIVLNDLDHWVAGQWKNFETRIAYRKNQGKYHALKKTNLKEGYIVRYADDFISPEKSNVVKLRKKQSEFLGFTIKAVPKRNKRVANTRVVKKKKHQMKNKYKDLVKQLQKSPTAENARP